MADLTTCSVCSAEFDRREPYAALSLSVEHVDDGAVDTSFASEVAACCGPGCLRQLWARLVSVLPDDASGDVKAAAEMLLRIAAP